MSLSPELISQFVKITNDNKKIDTKKESIVYGKATKTDGEYIYVKLDGSEIELPTTTTVSVYADEDNGDRVIVMIKNHSAIITGNLGSPSTTTGYVDTATGAVVETANNVKADMATINELLVKEIDAETGKIKYAKIEELEASAAEINDLKAGVADINTVLFGAADGEALNVDFANAVIALLGDAWIKSAMVDEISAGKILSGNILTNKVNVMSEDGGLIISDKLIQIKEGNSVRVQIGKDASGNYSIIFCDESGNTMFSKDGITEKAIKEAIIVNDMVSDTANIHAKKLDINSLFEEINGSTNTIKSSKIYLDDEKQTLESAFKSLATSEDVDKATTEMETKYSSLKQDLTSFETTVGSTYATKTEVGAVNLVNDQLVGRTSFGEWGNVGDGWFRCTYDNSEGNSVVYAKYLFPVSDYVSHLPANTALTVMVEMRDLGSTDGVYAYCYPENEAGVNLVQVRGSVFVYADNARDGITANRTTTAYVMPESASGKKKTALGGWIVAIPAGGTADVLLRQGIYEGNYSGNYVAPVNDTRNLNSRMTSVETSITQNTDSISSLVRRTEIVEDTFDNYSTKDETDAAINDVEIGGRNLLLDSGIELVVDRNYSHSLAPVELHNDDQFTYSVWLKASEDTTVSVYINDDTGQTRMSLYFADGIVVTTEYQRFVFTGKHVNTMSSASFIPDKSIRMRVYAPEGITLTGKLAKLELGNKPTDWTPAPEDLASSNDLAAVESSVNIAEERVTAAETLIQQLSDSISMLVTDGNGTSLMTQTDAGWVFSTADIQNAMNRISEDLSTLTDDVGNVDNTVSILQQAVEDLGVLGEYIQITTYEDEPCIVLGELDSDFKLRITNTRMMFTEGSVVLAYFTNQSFHSKKVVVEEELQQGGFVWRVRSNGNLGLVWKGGSN